MVSYVKDEVPWRSSLRCEVGGPRGVCGEGWSVEGSVEGSTVVMFLECGTLATEVRNGQD